ncbi:MAG: caspase family protein [Deltaproteobacteria bacterium]|nr:caspase family protein [Deltaproteobacteria bacterium]
MRRASGIAALAALAACASVGSGEKGAALVPFGPAGITAQASAPRRVALLVGIDRFEDERFPGLRFAAADARAMAGALHGFDQVQVLTAAEQTTRAAILAALADLDRAVRDPRDTVVLYLSTHGSLGRAPGGQLQRFLAARDTRMNVLAQTAIGVDDLLQAVDRLRSRRKVVVLATCHSGSGKSHLDDELAAALAEHKAALPPAPLTEVSEATIVLTACAYGETARESAELGHDIYTYFFLEGLSDHRADRDDDGAVTASEAHDYARDRTYAYTSGVQRPTAESDVLGRDPIVLAGALLRLAQPVLYSYSPSAEGLALFVDGTEKGALPGGVAVGAGAHEIELRDQGSGATLYRGSVELAAGQRSDMTRLIPRPRDLLLVAQLGGQAPLLGAADYLPPTLAAGAAVQVREWPWPHLVSTLRTSYLVGAGTAPGHGEVLPYWLHAIDLGLDVGYAFALGDRLDLTPTLGLGTPMAMRQFSSATYRGRELVRGTRATLALQLEWRVLEDLWLMPRLELGALAIRLGDAIGPYPYLSIGLGVGYAL